MMDTMKKEGKGVGGSNIDFFILAIMPMQVMAFSATYTPDLLADLEPLMVRPQKLMLCDEQVRDMRQGNFPQAPHIYAGFARGSLTRHSTVSAHQHEVPPPPHHPLHYQQHPHETMAA